MFKALCKSVPPLLLLAAVPALADEPVMSKYKVTLGGYVKLDYAHNSNASGTWTSPTGAPAGGEKEESIFTAKQSRFWLKVAGPEFMGAKTSAMIEADFYGNASLANEFGNVRMRHAYGTLDWSNTQVLFGQFWDTFGPTCADTIDFRGGADSGTPGSPRVPQLRLTQKLNLNADNALKLVLAVQNPVQDSATAGSNAFPSAPAGAYGDMVDVAGQIMFTSKLLGVSPGYMGLGMSPLQVGLFGLVGNEKISGNKSIDVNGYGFYGFVPLLKSADGKSRVMTLSLETEATVSEGLNVKNGTSIALVGTAPDKQAAKGYGVYGQLKFYPTQELGITTGYTHRGAIDHNAYRLATTAVTSYQKYNEISYTNLTYDLNAAIRLATEYEYHVTQYGAKPKGASSDVGRNNVFRVAAFYFF